MSIILLACPAYRDLRQKYFKNFFYTWPSSIKIKILMTTKSTNIIKNVAQYIVKAIERRHD